MSHLKGAPANTDARQREWLAKEMKRLGQKFRDRNISSEVAVQGMIQGAAATYVFCGGTDIDKFAEQARITCARVLIPPTRGNA